MTHPDPWHATHHDPSAAASALPDRDQVELAQLIINRLFEAGLELYFVRRDLEEAAPDDRTVRRIDDAIASLDAAICDVRQLAFSEARKEPGAG